jgi:hypothetical protein
VLGWLPGWPCRGCAWQSERRRHTAQTLTRGLSHKRLHKKQPVRGALLRA